MWIPWLLPWHNRRDGDERGCSSPTPLLYFTYGCKAQKSSSGLERTIKYSCFQKEQKDARATASSFQGAGPLQLVELAQTSTFTAAFGNSISSIITAGAFRKPPSLESKSVLKLLKLYENLCKSRSRDTKMWSICAGHQCICRTLFLSPFIFFLFSCTSFLGWKREKI